MNNNDFISRRFFFKKIRNKSLPILAGIAFGNLYFSCTKEDELLTQTLGGEIGPSSSGEFGASGSLDGHEYVDLGLSVKWATCNIGAKSIENYGSRLNLLYGAKAPRYEGDQESDLYRIGESFNFKNNSEGSIQGSNYDQARQRWGKNWALPTKEQWNELLKNTSQVFTTINGINGVKITGKNKKSIFLPLAGVDYSDSTDNLIGLCDVGEEGLYWTSQIVFKGAYSSQHVYGYIALFKDEKLNEIKTFNDWDSKSSVRPIAFSGGGSGGSTSCNNSCTNSATSSSCSNCATACTNGCKTTCTGTCPNGCQTLCGGQCENSCGGSCSYISAGSSCSGCAFSCSTHCYYSCNLACSESCMAYCIYSARN